MLETKSEKSENTEIIKIGIPKILIVGTVAVIVGILLGYGVAQLHLSIEPGTATATTNISELSAKVAKYIDDNFLSAHGIKCKIINWTEYENVVDFAVEVEFQGQKSTTSVYATKDGKFILLGSLFDLSKPLPKFEAQTREQQTSQSPISETELRKFVDCLAQAGLKIYGANWCGWTKRLVTMLGGFDLVAPIYVECTVQQELCDSEGIRGYPTIKINGTEYHGERTFDALSRATGCPVPQGANSTAQSYSQGGGCPG